MSGRHAHDPNCGCHLVDDAVFDPRLLAPATEALPSRLSRRGLLMAAAGVGALGLMGVRSAAAVERPQRLLAAGEALSPARRIPPPTTTTTTTTEPETVLDPDGDGTVGPLPFVEPEAGELLFPIVVEKGDRCGVLDNFGDTRGRPPPYYHQGVDIMADQGLPIRAVVNGVLTRRSETDFYGWTLYDPAADVVYRYFHNTADANGFEVGHRVKRGDIIGFVGDTGTSPGNYHLHFEYRPANVPADVYHLLQRQEHVQFWG